MTLYNPNLESTIGFFIKIDHQKAKMLKITQLGKDEELEMEAFCDDDDEVCEVYVNVEIKGLSFVFLQVFFDAENDQSV